VIAGRWVRFEAGNGPPDLWHRPVAALQSGDAEPTRRGRGRRHTWPTASFRNATRKPIAGPGAFFV